MAASGLSNQLPGPVNQQSNVDRKSPDCDDIATESLQIIDSSLFDAIQNLELDRLCDKDVTKVLPFLAKLLLNPSFVGKQQLLEKLYPIRQMNDVIQLLVTRGIDAVDTTMNPQISLFESSDQTNKLIIVASEYIRVQDIARQASLSVNHSPKTIQSELFDNLIYLESISYCLYMLLTKNTTISVMNILDMSEALLHVKYGPAYIIRLVANMPDRCLEVCNSLINYGERQDEGASFNEVSDQRSKTLRMLCLMNPSIALTVRATTLQLCKMPSLTVMITLDLLEASFKKYIKASEAASNNSDSSCDQMELDVYKSHPTALEELESNYDSAVAFITGIFLGVDEVTSAWFAQYTRSSQLKRIDQSHYTIVSKFRSQILQYMTHLFPEFIDEDHSIDCFEDKSSDTSTMLPSDSKELNRKLIRATATLRLFCALRGIGSLKLNAEESEILLRLITCRPKVNQTSINFATTGVCTLLTCSSLISNQKDERRAAEWLKWLIKESNYSDSRYSSHGKCSISELLLLIAIHFQNNQTAQIAELICATLSMKLQIKAAVSKCKSLFVQEVFTDQMVAEHAVKVPVTKNLDNNITEFLPIHCVHQLLESRSFSKHQVPIKDWIYEQICESRKPLHNMAPKLIDAYVNSVIVSTSAHGHCGTNQPILDEDIARVFKHQLYSVESEFSDQPTDKKRKTKKDEEAHKTNGTAPDEPRIVDVEAAQVLLLYYLLLYEEVRLKKNSDLSPLERANIIRYGQDFMMDVPIFYLLQVVRDDQTSYGPILPDLLKLVTSQYPQLCSIQHWLTTDHYEPFSFETKQPTAIISKITSRDPDRRLMSYSKSSKPSKVSLMAHLSEGYKNLAKDPLMLCRAIENILALPRDEIWPFVDTFISHLHEIICLESTNTQEYQRLIALITKMWWKFNTIFPRKLWVTTVNAIRRTQKVAHDAKVMNHSWDELALDPLIVLRCDKRVYRSPDFLNILLHILAAFLAASKRCLQDQIYEQPSRQKDFRNLEELRTTLILAQTSAAIQILLESCLPTEQEQKAIDKRESSHELSETDELLLERFNASVNIICEHLHQVFIADTNLAKLVHFQTYPSQLLPTTSDKIPSMHICLDFIPELLSQPDLSKQVFVIELTSHLCEKYAITKSLDVAKLCFNVAYTLLQLLPSERRASFFIPVLPALLRVCKVFPILREDANIILSQIDEITLAHMASTSSRLSLGTAKPFEGIESMSWKETKRLMNSSDQHEALYLCIQKCSLDLKLTRNDNTVDRVWSQQ